MVMAQSVNSSGSLGDESSIVLDENKPEQQQQQQQRHVIAKKETSAVIRLKLIVFLVLVASAVVAAIGVHKYISDGEQSKFEDQFKSDAHKIIEAIGGSLEKTLSAFDSLAVTLVSFAEYTNSSWPFVTLPRYGLRVSKLLPLSNALFIAVLPIVQSHQRVEWEEYSIRTDYWVNESIALLETWSGFYGRIIKDWEPNPIIHGFENLPYNYSGIHLPSWQSFPIVAEFPPYSYDWLTSTDPSSMYRSIENRHAVLGETYLLPTPGNAEAEAEAELWADYLSDYIRPNEDPNEPVFDFFYPIFNAVDRVEAAADFEGGYNTTSEYEIVGLLAASIYWRAMIRDNLPSDPNRIVVVFESPCNAPFTYQIDGPNVTYLGVGDMHDKQYDHLVIRSSVTHHDSRIGVDSQYSGANIDSEYCPHSMRLYPSDKMRSEYTTRNPRIFTSLSIAIFIFTSVVFILYDYFVERRQKLLLGTARRSTAIVSSLFPEAVHERLYPTGGPPEGAKNRLQSFLRTTTNPDSTTYGRLAGAPIAELYPETTVFFADIAGFTSWSASRQPAQVFQLLETLYGSFDEVAKQFAVFKVETIGDCYVAVAGLPVRRKDHAVTMVRFAQRCMDTMQLVITELEEDLGPGTADLSLRIGLHSGPTMAGVLRGEKPRFQLFGDTVNTAARMESNGAPNRIQVSQQTADLITMAGKGHWLAARVETIQAKGKGEMQTYWCIPKATSTSATITEALPGIGTSISNYANL